MIKQYLDEIVSKYKTGQAQEHSYRKTLEDLLLHLVNGIQVINEPKKQKCGKPDYIILKKDIQIGYIEAKDIPVNLNDIEESEQLQRYRESLDNLLLTNYLEFRFFVKGKKVSTVKIGELRDGKIITFNNAFQTLINNIRNFCSYKGQIIKSVKQLTNLMANKAVIVRDSIIKILENKSESSLHTSLKIFKKILLHDLNNFSFADMYAQTITYGLFVARLNDNTPENFSVEEARKLISKSNPFLRQLFEHILGANFDDDLEWIVNDLVDVFLRTDMSIILKNYNQISNISDPFLHFYETFLKNYDDVIKKQRGVYYTRIPIVKFIVNAVDEILKHEFNITHGLADDTKFLYDKIVQYDNSKKKSVPKTVPTETFKVQILDPATGTGTFLVETVLKIYEKFQNKQAKWSEYVDDYLIPRLNGFEIMMTPYVMCHLKLDLILRKTGYHSKENINRFKVYLTNSLDKEDDTMPLLLDSWLANESKNAEDIKSRTPIMVVMGNPPYSVSSINKNTFINKLIKPYKEGLDEKKTNLDDDYVKFIALGEHYISKNNGGILAYITNRTFLHAPTFRKMREHLIKTFDKIYIIDLHGDINESFGEVKEKDENVFGITKGVSINIFVKSENNKKENADVFYNDIIGSRDKKYSFLLNHTLNNISFEKVNYDKKNFFMLPKKLKGNIKYNHFININELFDKKSTGIETKNNDVTIQINKSEIENVIQNFKNLSVNELKNLYKETKNWHILNSKNDVMQNKGCVCKIDCKPFDTRYTYLTSDSSGFLGRPRYDVMKHMKEDNIGLVVPRQTCNNWKHCFITQNTIEGNYTASSRSGGAGVLYPLFLYHETQQKSFFDVNRTDNFNHEIISKIADILKMNYSVESDNSNKTFSAIDVLDYIYAILNSNKYRQSYNELLKIDFPHVPYPKNAKYFFNIVQKGKTLRKLHLLEDIDIDKNIAEFNIQGSDIISKISYKEEKIYINSNQYFDNVKEYIWNFYIGGYQPAKQYLKDRKCRTLSYEEVEHYQKMIIAISKTIEIMEEIDKIVEL